MLIEKKTTASQGNGEMKIMTNFETNEAMEILIAAKESQPQLFAQLPATTKMSLGLYQTSKARALTASNGLTNDELLELRGLKQSIAQDVLSPGERTSLALKISEMETK